MKTSIHGHPYNLIRDTTSQHLLHLSYAPHSSTTLPEKVDLRSRLPKVYDQGQLGSCTSNALTGAVQFDDPSLMGSRLFLYYNERMLDHDIPDDAGSTITQGVNALKKYGTCPETTWPYEISEFAERPPTNAYIQAVKHKVLNANRIAQELNSLKACLASNMPFALGISVYASFESNEVAKTGLVPMPLPNEELLGGHAVLVVGYDETKKVFIVRNSWGTSWGDNGYFYLPYQYVLDENLASDMWCISKVQI